MRKNTENQAAPPPYGQVNVPPSALINSLAPAAGAAFNGILGGGSGLALGGLAGGLYGAIAPGEYVQRGPDGAATIKKRGRLMGALRGLAAGAGIGGLAGVGLGAGSGYMAGHRFRTDPKIQEKLKEFDAQTQESGKIMAAGRAALEQPEGVKSGNAIKTDKKKRATEKQSKVYEAAESVENMPIKETKMTHKKCTPGEFGAMVKQSLDIQQYLPAAGMGAGLGAGMGALGGLINPGEEDEYDDDGRVIGRKQRNRFGAMMQNALMGAGVGGLAGGAARYFAPGLTDTALQRLYGMFQRQPQVQAVAQYDQGAGPTPPPPGSIKTVNSPVAPRRPLSTYTINDELPTAVSAAPAAAPAYLAGTPYTTPRRPFK